MCINYFSASNCYLRISTKPYSDGTKRMAMLGGLNFLPVPDNYNGDGKPELAIDCPREGKKYYPIFGVDLRQRSNGPICRFRRNDFQKIFKSIFFA